MTEQAEKTGTDFVDISDVKHVETKAITGSDVLQEARSKEPVELLSKRLIQLYAICFVFFLCSTMNGLMSSILVIQPFQREFGTEVVVPRLPPYRQYTKSATCLRFQSSEVSSIPGDDELER